MDVLDNEASEDEAMRRDPSFNRAPSHEANSELIEKERRYRDILLRAAASDETVRQKWDEWEGNIVQLTAEEVRQIGGILCRFLIALPRPSSKP
jgi:programmed cell death 6-interacting protein